jgi:hypothetical protein
MKKSLLFLLIALLVLPALGYTKDREINFELVVKTVSFGELCGFDNLALQVSLPPCGGRCIPPTICCPNPFGGDAGCFKPIDCPFPPSLQTIIFSRIGATEIIAFRASKGSGEKRKDGYYFREGNQIQKILETGDTLLGKVVEQMYILSQSDCAPPESRAVYSLFVLFSDGSQAIVKASIK